MKHILGETLRHLRKEKGITQEELAECLDCSFQSVSRWERGECYSDIDMLPGIANFFDITVDALLGTDERRKPSRLADAFREEHHLLRDMLKDFL